MSQQVGGGQPFGEVPGDDLRLGQLPERAAHAHRPAGQRADHVRDRGEGCGALAGAGQVQFLADRQIDGPPVGQRAEPRFERGDLLDLLGGPGDDELERHAAQPGEGAQRRGHDPPGLRNLRTGQLRRDREPVDSRHQVVGGNDGPVRLDLDPTAGAMELRDERDQPPLLEQRLSPRHDHPLGRLGEQPVHERARPDRFAVLRPVEPAPVPRMGLVAERAGQIAPGQPQEDRPLASRDALALKRRAKPLRHEQTGLGSGSHPAAPTTYSAQVPGVSETRTSTRVPAIAGWTSSRNQQARWRASASLSRVRRIPRSHDRQVVCVGHSTAWEERFRRRQAR